eukprot:UN3878
MMTFFARLIQLAAVPSLRALAPPPALEAVFVAVIGGSIETMHCRSLWTNMYRLADIREDKAHVRGGGANAPDLVFFSSPSPLPVRGALELRSLIVM